MVYLDVLNPLLLMIVCVQLGIITMKLESIIKTKDTK